MQKNTSSKRIIIRMSLGVNVWTCSLFVFYGRRYPMAVQSYMPSEVDSGYTSVPTSESTGTGTSCRRKT
jgi:hypothetical protein